MPVKDLSLAAPIAKQAPADAQHRDEFLAYVKDITQFQRLEVAKKVDKIANHQRLNYHYFWGCQAVAVATSVVVMRLWGPRNAISDKQYYLRPIGPVMVLGLTTWAIIHQMRYYLMKMRLWHLTEDFDYEIKRVKAHHVKEGALHLAWLQFVCEQVRLDKAVFMNLDALYHEPMLQQPKNPEKLRL
jgi:hypothetical protein